MECWDSGKKKDAILHLPSPPKKHILSPCFRDSQLHKCHAISTLMSDACVCFPWFSFPNTPTPHPTPPQSDAPPRTHPFQGAVSRFSERSKSTSTCRGRGVGTTPLVDTALTSALVDMVYAGTGPGRTGDLHTKPYRTHPGVCEIWSKCLLPMAWLNSMCGISER